MKISAIKIETKPVTIYYTLNDIKQRPGIYRLEYPESHGIQSRLISFRHDGLIYVDLNDGRVEGVISSQWNERLLTEANEKISVIFEN